MSPGTVLPRDGGLSPGTWVEGGYMMRCLSGIWLHDAERGRRVVA